MQWSTACTDWQTRILARQSLIPPPIFADQAAQALSIFKQLRVVDLPGKPTFGECSDEWVFDYVAAIFGAYEAETGKQLIREFFLLISKKNTKSTIAAGIMLTAVILCWREDEEHLILAPTKEIADNSFKPAAGMVRADDELAALFHVQDHVRTITHRVTRASLKVVAADTDTVSGKKAGRVLIDEHWLFGKKANADSMFMEATGGQVSRDEGFVIILTTQSDEAPAGVFREKLLYYRSVRDGRIKDPRSLGVLYEFPPAMIEAKAYLDPANFYVTNPNLGRSVNVEWLEDQLRKNREKTDGSLQVFLAKHLNVEIGLALMADRWAGADYWQPEKPKPLTLEELLERSEVVTIGADGGGLDDWLGMAVLGRERSGRWLLWNHAWVMESALQLRKSEADRWRDFARDGDLTICKSIGEDVDDFSAIVQQVEKSGLLDRVGVDQIAIGDIPEALCGKQDGASPILKQGAKDTERIVGISQGWRLARSIKTLERKVAAGEVEHGCSPMMAWCVGNAKVEARGNAVLITKQTSGKSKIDPLIATFNAVELMALNPKPRKRKYQVVIV